MHSRTTANISGVPRIHQIHPQTHSIRSGVEAAAKGLRRGLEDYHQLEQDFHTWLRFALNDKEYIKKLEVWEAIRREVGAL